MKLALKLIVGLLFCFELAIAQDDLREWIHDTGKHKTRAALVKVHENKIELRLENGEIWIVPVARLSKEDVAFLSDLALQQENPQPPPAAKGQPEKYITNSIGMKLVLIPKGTFLRGARENEAQRRSSDHSLAPLDSLLDLPLSLPRSLRQRGDEPGHRVTISQDYYLGIYEVRQSQYEKVMGTNPSAFQGDRVAERGPQTGEVAKKVDSSNHPVEQVSWEDAVKFCQRLSELPEEKKAGRVYRLPTEAEWEHACRAGSTTKYSFGDDAKKLARYAWFINNRSRKTHPVGKKQRNAWGLYDMHGNVWEWCADRYSAYPKEAVTDPVGPAEGVSRVYRGGSWDSDAADCRSSARGRYSPEYLNDNIGFRVALSSSGIPKQAEPAK